MIKRISVLYKDVNDILFQWWRLWSWWWWCEKRVEIRFNSPRWIMDKKNFQRLLLKDSTHVNNNSKRVLRMFEFFEDCAYTKIMQLVKFYTFTLFSIHTMIIIMYMNRVSPDYSQNSHNQNYLETLVTVVHNRD